MYMYWYMVAMLFEPLLWQCLCVVMEECKVLSLFIGSFLAGKAVIGTAHHTMPDYHTSIGRWCQLLTDSTASTTSKNQQENYGWALPTVDLSLDKSISYLQSGNALSGAFPSPRDETSGVPVWALAVVVASAGVTLIWLIAIVLLVRVAGIQDPSYSD